MGSGSSAADSAPLTEVVVVQPTPFCNISCRYCYLPDRNATTVMQQRTVESLFTKLFATGWTRAGLTVIWHAGEPLVVPPSFYEHAFTTIAALKPAALQLQHSLQTNGMLITEEWCDLFKRWNVGVGVSIDGPRHLHDANRVTRSGKGTFDKTLAGIRLLKREQVPFHVITVLGRSSMCASQEMLDFFLSEGVEDICFNVEESEGDHVSGLFSAADARSAFQRFLTEFWRLSRRSGKIRFLREIDGMLPRIFRPESSVMSNSQVTPFGMLNVDCHGNVSSFSPELLGLKNSEYGNFIAGNVHTHSFDEMRLSPVIAAMSRDISAGVEACRNECEYFSVCGGGSPINKLAENGSFRTTRTSFCDLTQMVPIDLVLDAVDRLQNTMDGEDSSTVLEALRHASAIDMPG